MTLATAPPRLVVEDLGIRVGASGPEVVSGVSFQVAPGQVLGLVGESGSGKTTVALALLGHTRRGLRVTSGSVRLDGVELVGADPGRLRALRGAKVAYVPQDPASALNPALRVGTQLSEVLSSHPEARPEGGIAARMAELLAEVGLGDRPGLTRDYPHQLSGGQQQRVAIAMAFALRPSLIVADEPTTGLDVTTQAHVLSTLRQMCEAHGVAAVYVSHDLAVVGTLVGTVAVLYAGRVVEAGATPQVFGSPAHPYTQGLVAAVPAPDRSEMLRGIEGHPPRPGHRPPGCAFAPRCPVALPACGEAIPPEVVLPGDHRVACLRATDGAVAPGPRVALPLAPARDGAPALVASGLSASYGATPVLHEVDLEVAPETCVAVVGESGSGKTTLARCLVGLHRSWTGRLTYRGTGLVPGSRGRPKNVLRAIQYVFQNPYTSLNPRKSIGQLVVQPLDHFSPSLSSSEREARVIQVLSDVSLSPDFLSRYPDQLSGGERQRVAIARALVVEPDLLVCDEVTSALDVSVQAAVVELLRALQGSRSLAMVFITHNLALVRSIAQSVVVLSQGEVVETGPVEEVLERPRHPYTARLMSDVPTLTAGAPRGAVRSG